MYSQQRKPPAEGSGKKVPIPRLGRREEPPQKPSAARQNRVSRACLSCRSRKIKCNGARPKCQNCSEASSVCIYASKRKDRLKIATDHNHDMAQLLRQIRVGVGTIQQKKIDELLASVTDDIADATAALEKGSKSVASPEDDDGEANISAEVGSNDELDTMDEDLLHSEQSRATGFLGKTSEVQWLRRLHHEADTAGQAGAPHEGPYGPPGKSAQASAERAEAYQQRQTKRITPQMNTSSCSFYLDDESFDMDFMIDPFEMPSYETAERLLMCYMNSVQNSFPILGKNTFTAQFNHYYGSAARGAPYNLPKKWQAMLNLVFAIGAIYSHLIEAEWRAGEQDHCLYHSRAWALSLKDPWWFTHPDLPQMQITGLLAFYYMAIGHLNRSWVVVGMALRFGYALGMHVRNEDRSATAVRKELLTLTWWSVYSLERILSAITGRPSIVAEAYCSVILPLPIHAEDIDEATIKARFGRQPRWAFSETAAPSETSEASSSRGFDNSSLDPTNSGSYLASIVKLQYISEKVLHNLYSHSIVSKSWKDVQQSITDLSRDLEMWVTALPPGLNFFQDLDGDQKMQQERNILKVHYLSTKLLTTRPCLCRLDRRISEQTQSSDDFNKRMATTCVGAAKAIAALVPDNMTQNRTLIYAIFPWWAAVHYLVQAMAILMLEMCYEADNPNSEQSETVMSLKKLVETLRELRTSNRMARRAYSIIVDLLKKLVARVKIDLEDLPMERSDEDAFPPDPRVWDPFASPFSGEQYLQNQNPFDTNSMSALFGDQGGTSQPFSNPFHESLYADSPLANLFLTGYDQHNPLSFGSSNVFMEYYQQQDSQRDQRYN